MPPPSSPTLRMYLPFCLVSFSRPVLSSLSFVLCRPSRLVSVGTLWAGRSGLVVGGSTLPCRAGLGERVWCPSVGFGREAAGRAGLVELAGRAARWVEHLRSRLVAAQSSILVMDRTANTSHPSRNRPRRPSCVLLPLRDGPPPSSNLDSMPQSPSLSSNLHFIISNPAITPIHTSLSLGLSAGLAAIDSCK